MTGCRTIRGARTSRIPEYLLKKESPALAGLSVFLVDAVYQ
jgi:hypothetical protein